jgi:hypothetical protein
LKRARQKVSDDGAPARIVVARIGGAAMTTLDPIAAKISSSASERLARPGDCALEGETMRQVLGVALVGCAVFAWASVRAQTPYTTYDAFMTLDSSERLARFGQLAPENQAALQREHLARWRALRADSLTDEQQRLLDAVASFIRPQNYSSDGARRRPDEVQAFLDLQRRASELFTPRQLAEFATLWGERLQNK